MDLGKLSEDLDFKNRITDFNDSVIAAGSMLDEICSKPYDVLSDEDKVRYDLFLAFSINSLYWLYLRTQGVDPNQHDLKSEINRVKNYMMKSKQVYEKLKNMPRIDQGAAKRFIRNGLWVPNDQRSSTESIEKVKLGSKRKREERDS